ncbi:MAG: hypothetical protein ACYSWT_11530 [Planctomycetota bacterium]|jgi:hypothetical protein
MQLQLCAAYGSVAIQIFPEVRLEALNQFVQVYLSVGHFDLKMLHALFKGRCAGLLLRDLALL